MRDDYSYFIENKIPYMFRYLNEDKIRTVIITDYIKEKDILVVLERGRNREYITLGIHFNTKDMFDKLKDDDNGGYEENYNYNNKVGFGFFFEKQNSTRRKRLGFFFGKKN
jgi:hypothetical protein